MVLLYIIRDAFSESEIYEEDVEGGAGKRLRVYARNNRLLEGEGERDLFI